MPVRPAVITTPTVARDSAGHRATRKELTRVRMPPSSRITANARLLTVSDRIIAEDDAAGAVDAGQHADRREDHRDRNTEPGRK